MSDHFSTPDPKTKDGYETAPVSGINHLRSIRSSEGPRTKVEGVRPPPKYLLLQDHKANSHEKLSTSEQYQQRLHTASSNPKYRIKTSNSAQKARNYESRGHTAQIRGYVSTKNQIEDLVGLQQVRSGTTVPERETHKSANRQGGPDIERLLEETVQLKRQLNQMQEENLKLKTRNSNLEKEASKLEKMFQESSVNPKKKNQRPKFDEMNAASFKHHFRELKDELEDKTEELNALKKKLKTTKINELEVQLRAFQEEGMRMKAHMDDILYKKAMIQKQGEENDTEVVRLRKELKIQEHAHKTLKDRYADAQNQLTEQDKRNRRELSVQAKNLQAKEKEIIKLKSQLIISTPPQTTTAKKATDVDNKDEKLRKELEKTAFENIDLKGQLKDKNDYIAQLERQLKDAGIQNTAEEVATTNHTKQFLIGTPEKQDRPNTRENTQKRTIFDSPSYPRKEESPEAHRKTLSVEAGQPVVEVKQQQAPKQEVKPEPPKQPKVSQEDVKKLGYEINLTLRVKGKTFDDVEKLDWTKKDGSVSVSHVSEVLRKEMFGLKSEEDINLLARYLTQENDAKSLIRSTLTSLIGPLPFWDEDMKKKLHLDISKTCTIYKESLEESLQLHSNGKYLTRKSLDDGAKSIDLPFTFAQLEYIITKLYERSHDVNKLSIESLFEVFHFDVSQHKPEDDGLHKRKSQRNTSRSQAGARSNDSGKRTSKNSHNDIESQYKQELDDVLNEYENENGGGVSERKHSKDDEEYKPEKAYESEEENSLEEKSRDNKEDHYERDIDIISDDQEDPDEKYEYLFPPQGEDEPQQEKITERGEEEEEDEYYKEQHEEEVLSDEEPVPATIKKKKSEEKVKSEEVEEEEYKDEEYDEEPEPLSSENRRNEGVEASGDHRRMGSGSEMLESRQMMESAKTNFTNTTQISDPRSDFHPFEESKERVNARSEERLDNSPEIANKKREDRRESQEETKKRLPDITEEYDKHEEFEENFDEDYENDFDN